MHKKLIILIIIYLLHYNNGYNQDNITTPERIGVKYSKDKIGRTKLVYNNNSNIKPDTVAIGLFDRNDRTNDAAVYRKLTNEITFYRNVGSSHFTPFYTLKQSKPVRKIESFIPENYAPYLTKYHSLEITYTDGTKSRVDNSKIYEVKDSSSLVMVPEWDFLKDGRVFLYDYQFIEKKRFQTGYWNEYTTVGDIDKDGLIEVIYTFQTSPEANHPATMVVYEILPNNQYRVDWDTLLPMGGTNRLKDVFDLNRDGKKECFGVGYRDQSYYNAMLQCNGPGKYEFIDSSIPWYFNDAVVVDTCQFDSLKRVGVWASYDGSNYSHIDCFYVKEFQGFFWGVKVFGMSFFGGDGFLDLEVGDIDEDGQDEVVMGDVRTGGSLFYLDSTGVDTTYGYEAKYFGLSGPVSAGWNKIKDLNKDGKMEIIGTGDRPWGGSICILKHTGSPGENNFETVWFDTTNLRESPNWGIDSSNINGKYTILYSNVKSDGPHAWLQLSTYTQIGNTLSMYKSSNTEVDSSAMKNPVMYDIDKDGNADILGSMGTGWPGYPYRDHLIIWGQDYVTDIGNSTEPLTKKDYVLYQNYPNPFNPTTKIKFTIPSVSSPRGVGGDLVQLKFYDITGREIQTLVNEPLNPGTYEKTFNGSNLSSGIYLYALSANGKIMDCKKLVLIK
jgi:Secretion system C-terminal sorting domain